MKKPTKKPLEITEDSHWLEGYIPYTPEDFRDVADRMEENGIISIEIEGVQYEGGPEFTQKRMETPIEAEVRYAKEMKKWEKWKEAEKKRKENQRQKIIKEAKKLGLTISE